MRNKELENIFTIYKLYIDTCSFMEESNGFFEFELIPLLTKLNKKLYVIENVRQELERNKNKSSKYDKATYGLNNLSLLEKHNLVEFEKSSMSQHADGAFLPILIESRRHNNVCLITEDKRLALTAIANLKHIECVDYDYDIQAIRLNSGNPQIWNAEEIKDKIDVAEVTEHKLMSENHLPKLEISFVIDNSISMKGDRLDLFKDAFKSFADEMSVGDMHRSVEYEVVCFEDFSPRVLKKFKEEDFNINGLSAGKMPFLDRSINKALDDLETRITELRNMNTKLYKPWLIVLSDGQSFDDTLSSSARINSLTSQGELLFIPFNLTLNELSDKINSLEKEKFFIKVGENKFKNLVDWIIKLVVDRLTTPLDQNVRIKKESFDGWAVLK